MRSSEFGMRNTRRQSRDRQGATERACAPTGRSLTVAVLLVRNPQSGWASGIRRFPPSAFTLVELLVAIAIIAILASLLLGVAASAAETAREAKTKQLVARIHTLLMEKYESYRTQRVELVGDRDNDTIDDWNENLSTLNTGIIPIPPASQPGLRRAAGRLAAARELMKLEMPDRWSDLMLRGYSEDPIPNSNGVPERVLPTDSEFPSTLFIDDRPSRPSLNLRYIRLYNQAVDSMAANPDILPRDQLSVLLRNQSAECLYMVVMNATADGEARSLFNEDDVGDTDGDGAPEFLDGWGNPISWLRWAPGFYSETQLSYPRLAEIYTRTQLPNGVDGVVTEVSSDHDPLDMFRVDKSGSLSISDELEGARGWRLLPLIYSAGPDEETGVRDDVAAGSVYFARADPYADVDTTTSENQWLGQPADENGAAVAGEEVEAITDNITNHLITAR